MAKKDGNSTEPTIANWHALANAIIIRQVDDYKRAKLKHLRHPESQALEHNYSLQKKQFEEFVNSEWYTVLTKVPAEVVLKAVEIAVEQELRQKQPNTKANEKTATKGERTAKNGTKYKHERVYKQ